MNLAVELFKEVGNLTSLISCSYRLDENNNPRLWSRNEAILGGLMVRLSKLQIGFIEQICNKRQEIAMIIFRSLSETIVNILYLLKNKKSELFDEYIEYSLRSEKNLLNLIKKNVDERGYEIPIEKRMKKSILRSFETSNFSIDQVNEKNYKSWGDTIFKRAKSVGLGDMYLALFGLPSHAVHGNWQDLIMNHLEVLENGFAPNTNWDIPNPQPILAISIICCDSIFLYLCDVLPECPDKEYIKKLIDDLLERIYLLDKLHEEFLQRKSNGI